MKIIDINNIEELIMSKREIENALINEGKLENRISLDEFILKYINISSYVYMLGNKVIPFSLKTYGDEKYLFMIDDDKISDVLAKELKDINYDLSNLTNTTNSEILQKCDDPENISGFILNGKFMSKK